MKGQLIYVVLGIITLSGVYAASREVRRVVEGDNFVQPCQRKSDWASYYWTKQGSDYIQARIDLVIYDIKRNYSGYYECRMYYTNKTDYEVLQLLDIDVQYAAEVTSMTHDRSQIDEGQSVEVTCELEGNPDPRWSIRNMNTGQELFSTDISEYRVSSIPGRCTSNGYWACTGFNEYNDGKNASRGFDLRVNCAPRPDGPQYYTKTSKLGESVRLEMKFLAYPAATFTWYREEPLPNRGTVIGTNHTTMLHIDNIQISDFGNYTVRLENEFGIYTTTYELKAKGAPQTPTNFRYTKITPNTVTLRWTSGYDMGSPQHFMIVKLFDGNAFAQMSDDIYDYSASHGVGVEWEHVLLGLETNTFYNLSVAAENEFPYITFSQWTSFYTPSDIPGPAPNSSSGHVTSYNKMMIAGISVASIACITLVALLIYRCRRNTKSSKLYEKL